jgi:hypothetical protein
MPHAASHPSTKAKSSSSSPHRWSKHVAETSDALDLPKDMFKQSDPKRIAADLKRSAEHSRRRHAEPYRSAMSMLTFYLNRAGKTLGATQKRRLEAAKDELRELFGRPRRHPPSSGAGK